MDYRGNIVRRCLVTTSEPTLNSFNSIGNFSGVLEKRSISTGDGTRGGWLVAEYICEYLEKAMSQNARQKSHLYRSTIEVPL